MGEVYGGDALEAKYTIVSKKEEKGYGILRVDYEIANADRPILVSRSNLCRIKK